MDHRRLKWLFFLFVIGLGGGPAVAAQGTGMYDSSAAQGTGTYDASPALTMSSDLRSSPAAIGGYRPIEQIDEPGAIKAEPFTIRAKVNAAIGHDDNVALSKTNKISSAFYGLSPVVGIGLEGATQRYTAIYRGNYGNYSSSPIDDYKDHNVTLNAANEWSARLRSLVRYDYFHAHDARGATSSAVTAPDRWDLNALRGSLSYGAAGAQGRIEVDFGVGDKRYITNRVVTAARDYEQIDVGGTFYYRVGPATQALVQIRRSDIDYKLDTTPLDSNEMRYLVGLKWDATAKTQGTAKVGYMRKNFANPSKPDYSAPSYEAGVTWSPLTYSIVNMTAMRTFSEQTSGGNFIVTNMASLLWNHDWSSRVRSTMSVIYGRDVHQGLGRTDTRENAGLRVSYGLQRWLRLGGEYRYEARNSNVPTAEYTRNMVLFTLEASL